MYRWLSAAGVLIAGTSLGAGAADIPDYIPPPVRPPLLQWLAANPGWRLATDVDCNCASDIDEVRQGGGAWPANPTYHPYFVSGDFNGDGKPDVAVIVLGPSDSRALLIFNGPLTEHTVPAYRSTKHVGALFFGPPRPRPYRLLVGEFATEAGALRPRGRTYVYESADCC